MNRIVSGGSTVLAVVTATLVGEAMWAVRRPLPTQFAPAETSNTQYGSGAAVRPLRVVALGDSTLTGPGLAHPDQVWLRQAFVRLGHERPVEFISLATGGSKVADTLGLIPDVVALAPDLVVIAVGANDALHTIAVKRVRADFDRLVGELLETVPVVAVANIGDLGNMPRMPPPLSNVMRARGAVVRAVIENVIVTHDRAVLLDVCSADDVLRDRRVFTPDLFHPGEAGHSAWAEAVLPDLRVAVDRASALASGRT